ncbi:MAG: hypothetical protein ACOCR0_01320 [Haloferacaceae archaeon]
MKEIESTAELDAPRELVEELLSPPDIIEYEGTYEVDHVGEDSRGRPEVRATADNIETAFAFEELPNGYAFEQTGDEPFDEKYTSITVYGEDGEVEVVARSEFTFGGWSSFVLDWFAVSTRRSELQRTLLSLARAVDEELDDGDGDSESTSGPADEDSTSDEEPMRDSASTSTSTEHSAT